MFLYSLYLSAPLGKQIKSFDAVMPCAKMYALDAEVRLTSGS